MQLVPNAFVVRMTRAFDELGAEVPAQDSAARSGGARRGAPAGPRWPASTVRVWAELGPRADALRRRRRAPAGAVVELNRQADEPIDLYVNGRRFATGRLVVADGADWAVRIEHVLQRRRTRHEKEVT